MKRVSNPNPSAFASRPKAPLAPPKVSIYEDDTSQKDVIYYKQAKTVYGYSLDSDIGNPSEYRNLLQCLESMEEGDAIEIEICCYGGYLHSTIMICNAIRNCKGHVHGILNGVAMSGGSIVLLACHSVTVLEHSELMAHTSLSGQPYQKLSDTLSSAVASGKQLSGLYKDIYYGFFSEEEINKILEGKDYYLLYDEIVSRLEKRSELFEQEHKAKQELHDAEQKAEYDAMMGELEDDLPDPILKKLTKPQLIQYIKAQIDVVVNEDGSFDIVDIEDDENN